MRAIVAVMLLALLAACSDHPYSSLNDSNACVAGQYCAGGDSGASAGD